jgi:hypothetical protein
VKVNYEIKGLDQTLRAFNQYGKDANRELRQAAGVHAERLVAAITLAGQANPQSALAASSVKRRADRVPAITAGGSRRIKPTTRPRRKVSAGDIFFGAEFGGGRRPSTRQFPPYAGRRGYWFWPTIRASLPVLRRDYIDTLNTLAAKWAAGGNEPGG